MTKRNADSGPSRERVLILTPDAPYPVVGGGALRVASLIEYYGRHYDLDVLVFREPRAHDPTPFFPPGLVNRVEVIPLPANSRSTVAKAIRNARRFAAGVPPLVDRFSGFEAEIERRMGGNRYKLALVCHLWCARYRAVLARHADSVGLDLPNVESALFARMAESEPWPERLLHRRFAACSAALERELLPRYSFLLTTSEADRVLVKGFNRRVEVYPNTIPVAPRPAARRSDVILFTGNLEYHPNVTAVRHFRDHIWPLIAAARPGVKWRLAGLNDGGVRHLVARDPSIEVLGRMENAIETLAAAKVAVVPLLSGSGTRLKILEAWAAGTAVVSTRIGAEGLDGRDGEHLLIRDDPADFAAAVIEMLENPVRAAQLQDAGRCLYEERYTWNSAWEKLGALEGIY